MNQAELQAKMKGAADRLHHISMIYGAAIVEVAKGEKVGALPVTYPGLHAFRDLCDLILFTRAEINAISKVLIDVRLVSAERLTRTMTEEYEWLANTKALHFGVTVTDVGLDAEVKDKPFVARDDPSLG
jgi:hypothetical protein